MGKLILDWRSRLGKLSVGRPPPQWSDDLRKAATSREPGEMSLLEAGAMCSSGLGEVDNHDDLFHSHLLVCHYM